MDNQVICGDSCDVLSGMLDESVDLIVTDIPYGINYKSNKQNYDTRNGLVVKDRPQYFSKINGDAQIPVDWLDPAFRVLKNNSAVYIFCHWSTYHLLVPSVQNAGFKPKNMIVLNKSNHGMGDLKGQYAPKHELMLFAVKGRHLLNFSNGRMKDVWDVPVKYSGSKRFHPNEKPISWIEPCIRNSSRVNDVVLDPFAGSGTVGVAATLLSRRSISIEIDDQYVEIARQRMHDAGSVSEI